MEGRRSADPERDREHEGCYAREDMRIGRMARLQDK